MSDPNQQPSHAPRTLRRGVPRGVSNPISRPQRNPISQNENRERRNFPIRRPGNFQNFPRRRPPIRIRRIPIRNFPLFRNLNRRRRIRIRRIIPRTLNYRRLFISGFGNILNNNQLHTIFSPYGRLSRCNINYDIMGRSTGTANVNYIYPEDARRAIKFLNGAQIGRRFMIVRYDRNRFNFGRRFGFGIRRRNRVVIRRRRGFGNRIFPRRRIGIRRRMF